MNNIYIKFYDVKNYKYEDVLFLDGLTFKQNLDLINMFDKFKYVYYPKENTFLDLDVELKDMNVYDGILLHII